jgi:hypothetical protein
MPETQWQHAARMSSWPLIRSPLSSTFGEFFEPRHRGSDHLTAEVASVALSGGTKVLGFVAEVPKRIRNRWPFAAPVDEVACDEHAVNSRVPIDILGIGRPVMKAVMGVELSPSAAPIGPVDVVAEGNLPAAGEIRPLGEEAGIAPIFGKRERLLDVHCIDGKASAVMPGRSGPEDPVADLRTTADLRLARRKRAPAIEGVRRKAEITGDYVTEYSQGP